MAREFARAGIRIQYPENWTFEEEDTEDGWSASVVSPETAFLMLSHYPDDREPAELADMALAAMRESYPDLESAAVIETLAEVPVVGYDVDFFALDLTNTCWIRALAAPEGCLLMMSQCTDQELETNGETLQAIGESLTFAEDDE
jgi:hypothetical protein